MRSWRGGLQVVGALACLLAVSGRAQIAGGPGATIDPSLLGLSSTTPVTRTLRGRVVNALDGSALPRALVTINGRSQLTDAQGRYEFANFTDTQAHVMLQKPGFSANADGSPIQVQRRLVDLDADADLVMYPDAVISGTVTGGDRLPLSGVSVTLLRELSQPGGIVWQNVRTAITDVHGEYRFRAEPGRFRVTISYISKSPDTGESILPLIYPATSSTSSTGYFTAGPGESKQIDLQPKTGFGLPVLVRFDGDDAQRGAQVWVETSNGQMLNPQFFGTAGAGTIQLMLPRGTYTVFGRTESRDNVAEGSALVTVAGRQNEVTLHLQPAASLPVEVAIDSQALAAAPPGGANPTVGSAETFQQPTANLFNLRLHRLDAAGSQMQQDLFLRSHQDKTFEFRAPPGRYQLMANQGGSWYIEGATYGTNDLASGDIVVSQGGGGGTIRLLVGNAYGNLVCSLKFGSVTSDIAWIYLIPKTPALTQPNPAGIGNPGGGAPTRVSMRAAPGEYLAVAFDHWARTDMRDPAAVAKLSTAAKSVTITASGTTTVDLELAEEKEETP